MTEKQGGSDVRANTTTAAPLNGGGPGRRVRAHRPQVVHVGADVRRVPRPRPGRGRALLLLDAALHARTASATRSRSSDSRTSSATAPTPPARSSSAAPGRGWSARRAAACRRSSRWSTTPGSTAASAPRPGCAPASPKAIHHTSPAGGVRQAADRPAADAKRARRPRDRVGGGDDRRAAPARAYDQSIARRRGRDAVQARRQRRSSSTGSASAPSRTPARRSSASAATASSRSRGCRACTASRR